MHTLKNFYIFSICFLLFTFISGCATNNPSGITTEPSTVCRLKLLPDEEDNVYFTLFSPEDLGKTYTIEMEYYGFSEVQIEIDGQLVELLNAIRTEQITPEEIIAFAKIDARNGFCQMKYQSNLGYAHYAYCYENFEVVTTYDVFEAADGEQHHIEEMWIAKSGFFENSTFGYPRIRIDEELVSLGRENWGLELKSVQATTENVTIHSALTGGQYIGNLQVVGYELLVLDENGKWKLYPKLNNTAYYTPTCIDIQQGITDFSVNWSTNYGILSCGKYKIRLYIQDIYEKKPDLMKNYLDRQDYSIEFLIEQN